MNKLKIITWNCNGAFRKKIKYLKSLDADIYIIQECEYTDQAKIAYEDWLPNYFWKGSNKNRGLAIFAKEEIEIEALDWEDNHFELFLPVQINKNINLVAIWTKNSSTFQYIGQLWGYLQLHKNKLIQQSIILCGDLNSNAIWDKPKRIWNHSSVVNELNDLGISSLYHDLNEEVHGSENQNTFFMHRNIEKPYHIDYLFYSKKDFDISQASFKVLDRDVWLKHSDHLPIICKLKVIG